jgi:Reverse transcriptase (RNA-dependent DNA polymerase)
VQSARQFFKKLTEVLKLIGFKQSNSDPCLLMKSDDKLAILIISVYVDDLYAIGDEPALLKMIKLIQNNGLKAKVENDLSDYLSCEVLFGKNLTKAWQGQPQIRLVTLTQGIILYVNLSKKDFEGCVC